jgi:hypothetical protein
VLHQGQLVGWFDRASHHLVTFDASDLEHRWADALAELVRSGSVPSIEVRKVNGEPTPSDIAEVLESRGFVQGYRGPVLRGDRRR